LPLCLVLCAVVISGRVETATASPDSPLTAAVKRGDTAAVRALLQKKADVNAPEADGTTALHWAAHRDDTATADVLIRAGAEVDAANRYGVRPIALAAVNGNAAMIELLLEAGANPNLAQPEGETPLMTAARSGNALALQVLLAHGADVKARERWRGQDALTWAAGEGHIRAAQLLLAHGADVNARSNDGYTPLAFAARQGHSDLVKVLLEAGANINDTTKAGPGPLTLAIHNSHWDIAALLLEKGADPNINASGSTPLHLAIQVRDPHVEFFDAPPSTSTLESLDVIKMLLDRGVDVNARMTRQFPGLQGPLDMPLVGATPFFVAAKSADVEVMRLLLKHGADPLLATQGKATPLMAAAGVGFRQGASLRTEAEALEAVKLAFEHGGNVNAANAIGFTALHGAAIRGANAIVKFLVEKGARLDAKDKIGRTPFMIAEEGAGDSTQRRQLHTAALLRELMAAR
jgi:ankyrin repeat protein